MSFAHPLFASPRPVLPRSGPVPQDLQGTRAALFHLWRDPALTQPTARQTTPVLAKPVLAKTVLAEAPPPEPQGTISGNLSASFARAPFSGNTPAVVRLGPMTAAPAKLTPRAVRTRQRLLKDTLQDDMFVF